MAGGVAVDVTVTDDKQRKTSDTQTSGETKTKPKKSEKGKESELGDKCM